MEISKLGGLEVGKVSDLRMRAQTGMRAARPGRMGHDAAISFTPKGGNGFRRWHRPRYTAAEGSDPIGGVRVVE